ncbi:reverse transcriptase/maturase family protein [Streptomyces sp. NPDC060002]|uniref:reverse transcriptase/maturase family protein n=1 Tax=Streptomyces sp. NPDC060002 TaxID=3347033 RepID=UPI0036A75CCF
MIRDRALQARVKNALEPEWEARFETRSYGFRPGRGCHDAIEAIFGATARKDAKRMWVLDADLAAAFDRISRDHLLDAIGQFPEKEREWLKAGVLESGRYAPTEEGTPQGPARWGDQSSAAERCTARDGRGRRVPLSKRRSEERPDRRQGHPDPCQICR